jgi:hypothetical protein
VLAAELEGAVYALDLGLKPTRLGSGDRHLTDCLRQLALHGNGSGHGA